MSHVQERIDETRKEFSEKTVSEQIRIWHKLKSKQEKKPKGECVSCKSYGLTGIFAGSSGARFARHADGKLTVKCGKRGGKDMCPGYVIEREPYVDQVTITKEIQSSMRELRRDLKIIRDRVLATQTLDDDDKKGFREMSEEYAALKQIEEIHKQEIEKVPDSFNSYYIDSDILLPSAFFGDTDNIIMKTPMIIGDQKDPSVGKSDPIYMYEEQTIVPICKEDIPVRVLIDERADDS